MGIKCFFLEPTERKALYLRRYRSPMDYDHQECPRMMPAQMTYHDAMVPIGEAREVMDEEKRHWVSNEKTVAEYKDDPRWPTHCACGYQFQEKDSWQVFSSHIYRRADTGEEMTLRDAPDGAMWDATWFHDIPGWCGPDGRALICRVPNKHDWHIDGSCSNCTRPNEPHKCWIRHGIPPLITVDKSGDTCSAGAGSVLTSAWHGFLRNGELVT